jgi:hypothetical protein
MVNRQQHHDDNTMKRDLMPADGRISPAQIRGRRLVLATLAGFSVRRDWG